MKVDAARVMCGNPVHATGPILNNVPNALLELPLPRQKKTRKGVTFANDLYSLTPNSDTLTP